MNRNAEYQLLNRWHGEIRIGHCQSVSNYSEWVFPEIEWIIDETIITISHEKGGELDELKEPLILVKCRRWRTECNQKMN